MSIVIHFALRAGYLIGYHVFRLQKGPTSPNEASRGQLSYSVGLLEKRSGVALAVSDSFDCSDLVRQMTTIDGRV